MTTFTIELPDELAARMAKLPPEQRNNFAVSALSLGVEALDQEGEGGIDREAVEDLRKAFAMGMNDSVTVSLEDYAKSRGIRL